MSYKRITTMDIYEIIRRWHDNRSITHIANTFDYDRKTVRKYIYHAKANGIKRDQPLPEKKQVISLMRKSIQPNKRQACAQQVFEPYLQEINDRVQNDPPLGQHDDDIYFQQLQRDAMKSLHTLPIVMTKFSKLK